MGYLVDVHPLVGIMPHPRQGPRSEPTKKPRVVVTVFGCWPNYTRKDIEKIIKQCQRTMNQYQWKMTKSLQGNTTHVILTQSWYYHLDDRFQLVEKSKFKKLEWLLDCAAQGKLLCGEDSKHCWFPDAAPKTGSSMARPTAEPKTGTGKVGNVRHSGKEYEVTIQQARKRNSQDRMRVYNMKVHLHDLIRQ